jgi:hypothetical protein
MAETRKEVFIGVSATHYDVHAGTFEKATGIPSVNMGLHAGGSFELYINCVLPYLNKGDMVFIMPEYACYSFEYDAISDESVDLMYLTDSEIVHRAGIPYQIKCFPETLMVGWRHLGNMLKYPFVKAANGGNVLGNYRRDWSDTYGDYIGFKNIPNSPYIAYESLVFKDKGFISDIQKAATKMQENGVVVFHLFPPYPVSSYEKSKQEIARIYSDCKQELNFQLLFTPEQTVFNDNCFFDTVYHLDYDNAEKYTQFIIEKFIVRYFQKPL